LTLLPIIGTVHPAYNPSFSACFFSRNNIFLSQQISQQCFSAGLSAQPNGAVTEPSNYDGPHVPAIVVMTSDNRTYVPHNLKGMLSSEQDPITGVLQYYNNLFKIPLE
jgi:hypothetical protein